jgi:hypothetical protein
MNVGDEQVVPVKIGPGTYYPDLILMDGKRLAGLVEVESAESVNKLEAMAEWVTFSRAKAPLHLYVPVQAYDAARRLWEANQARPAEVWTYRTLVDGFDLIKMYSAPGTAGRTRVEKVSTLPPPPKAAAAPAASSAPARPAAPKPPGPTRPATPKAPSVKPIKGKPAKPARAAAAAGKAGVRKPAARAAARKAVPARARSAKGKSRAR